MREELGREKMVVRQGRQQARIGGLEINEGNGKMDRKGSVQMGKGENGSHEAGKEMRL